MDGVCLKVELNLEFVPDKKMNLVETMEMSGV
jgi:hypothetical protein